MDESRIIQPGLRKITISFPPPGVNGTAPAQISFDGFHHPNAVVNVLEVIMALTMVANQLAGNVALEAAQATSPREMNVPIKLESRQ